MRNRHRLRRRPFPPRRRSLWVPLLALLAVGILTAGVLSLWLPAEETGEAPPRTLALFRTAAQKRVDALEAVTVPDWISQEYIPTQVTARRGERLSDYTGVVLHYVGNPGTTAAGNRNYFATPGTEVCAHFVVGLEGEIIQCLPLWERSVASNQRNRNTISVEVCHPDDSGEFSAATYEAVVRLLAWLCDIGELDTEQVIRHYDVTGKECPRYYVKNEEAWQQLLQDVVDFRQNL